MCDQCQEQEWRAFVRQEHAAGRCEYSGYPFPECVTSVCDCGWNGWTGPDAERTFCDMQKRAIEGGTP